MLSIHISKYILFLTVGFIAYDNDVYITIGVHILTKRVLDACTIVFLCIIVCFYHVFGQR